MVDSPADTIWVTMVQSFALALQTQELAHGTKNYRGEGFSVLRCCCMAWVVRREISKFPFEEWEYKAKQLVYFVHSWVVHGEIRLMSIPGWMDTEDTRYYIEKYNNSLQV